MPNPRARRLNTASTWGIGDGCSFHRSILFFTDSRGKAHRSCIHERYWGNGILSGVGFSSQDYQQVIQKSIKLESYSFEISVRKNSEIGAQREHRGHWVRRNFRPHLGQTALDLNVSKRNPHPGASRSPHAQCSPTGGDAWQ
jgi:hypothetical protein